LKILKNFKKKKKKNYLKNYKNWNYYKNIKYITNNTLESFKDYLNNLFSKKKKHFF